MKKSFKRVLTLTLALLMLLTPMNVFAKRHQKRDIPLNGIIVNDHIVFSDVAPYIKKGRTFVPIRFIAEELGFDVKWDAKTRTATMTEGDSTVVVTIGSKTMLVNGEARELDLPAEITDGRTFVPLRAISEAFGKKVDYSADYRAVCIGDEVEYDKDYRVVYYYDKIDPVITEYEINIVTYKMTVKGEVKSFDTVEDLINVILDDFEQYKTKGKSEYGLVQYVPNGKKFEYSDKVSSSKWDGIWHKDCNVIGTNIYIQYDEYITIKHLSGNKYSMIYNVVPKDRENNGYFSYCYAYLNENQTTLTPQSPYKTAGVRNYFSDQLDTLDYKMYQYDEEKDKIYESSFFSIYYDRYK